MRLETFEGSSDITGKSVPTSQHVIHSKITVSTWWCIGLSALSLLPPGARFRTTTGVHLHTGFKTWLRCDPSVVRGPLETEAGEDAVPGNTRSLWQPPSSTNVCCFFSWKKKIRRYQAFGQWANWSPDPIYAVISVLFCTLFLQQTRRITVRCCFFHTLNQIWDQTFWNKDACFQACRLVLQLRKYDLWKMRMYMRGSMLWTILPVGLRQLTGSLFQPNPFLFTLWIIGQLARLPS